MGECLKTPNPIVSTGCVEWFDKRRRMVRQAASNGSTGGVERYILQKWCFIDFSLIFHCFSIGDDCVRNDVFAIRNDVIAVRNDVIAVRVDVIWELRGTDSQ